MTIIILLLSGTLNGVAQIFWKRGTGGLGTHQNIWGICVGLFLNPSFLAGFFLYGISIILWLFILSKTEVSYAYPFLAISFIVVLIGGYFLGEHVNLYRIIGVLCIIIGILFISRS